MIKCCPAVQEEKIAALQSFADQLIGADHYAKPEIFNRCNEVLDRFFHIYLSFYGFSKHTNPPIEFFH